MRLGNELTLSLPRAPSLLASTTTTSSLFPQTRTTHPWPRTSPGTPPPPCSRSLRPPRVWPGQLGQPQAEPSCPLGVHDSPGASPPLLLRRRRPPRRKSAGPRRPLLQIHVKGFAQEFEEREGSIYEVVTHMNSVYRGLFARIYFMRSIGSSVQCYFSFMAEMLKNHNKL